MKPFKAERKMLRVIKRLKQVSPIPIRATFLGCHAVPAEFNNSSDYTDHVISDMLPQFVSEGLIDYVDAFCETGYFSKEVVTRLIDAASRLKIKCKIHVNQFNILGGVKLCVNGGALSVDHLEIIDDADIAALKESLISGSPTFPVALPLCSHFLSLPYTPGRKLVDAGLPLFFIHRHYSSYFANIDFHWGAATPCRSLGSCDPRTRFQVACTSHRRLPLPTRPPLVPHRLPSS